jgi:hypothetical protein
LGGKVLHHSAEFPLGKEASSSITFGQVAQLGSAAKLSTLYRQLERLPKYLRTAIDCGRSRTSGQTGFYPAVYQRSRDVNCSGIAKVVADVR